MNMGDFNSLRIDVGLEVDGVGDPNPTFDKAWNWAETKLIEKIRSVEEELKK